MDETQDLYRSSISERIYYRKAKHGVLCHRKTISLCNVQAEKIEQYRKHSSGVSDQEKPCRKSIFQSLLHFLGGASHTLRCPTGSFSAASSILENCGHISPPALPCPMSVKTVETTNPKSVLFAKLTPWGSIKARTLLSRSLSTG